MTAEKAIRYEEEYNLNPEIARLIVKENSEMFERFVKKYKNVKPAIIAQTLVSTTKDLKKRLNLDVGKLKEKDFDLVLF